MESCCAKVISFLFSFFTTVLTYLSIYHPVLSCPVYTNSFCPILLCLLSNLLCYHILSFILLYPKISRPIKLFPILSFQLLSNTCIINFHPFLSYTILLYPGLWTLPYPFLSQHVLLYILNHLQPCLPSYPFLFLIISCPVLTCPVVSCFVISCAFNVFVTKAIVPQSTDTQSLARDTP